MSHPASPSDQSQIVPQGERSGWVFDIQKFAIHDGPGIRTAVFLKGCPLKCVWCHNPESQERAAEISFIPGKCIGCGACFKACPRQCHEIAGAQRQFRRERCERCGACASECHAHALEVVGKDMTVAQVLEEVCKDKPFYDTSGGGMTLSGGEPMAQFAFTRALARAARDAGLHVCVETSGFAPWSQYEQLLDTVNLFLYDYKESDPARHREFTGVPPDTILENLMRLNERGVALVLRCPIVPGYNEREDHFRAIAALANDLCQVREINLLPYHPLGDSKLGHLGKVPRLPVTAFVSEAKADSWVQSVAARTRVPVRRA